MIIADINISLNKIELTTAIEGCRENNERLDSGYIVRESSRIIVIQYACISIRRGEYTIPMIKF